MKPSKYIPNAVELSSTDVSVLMESLDYCQSLIPDTFSPDKIEALRDLEDTPEPIVIIGTEARLTIGALSIMAEEASDAGKEARKVIEDYKYELKRNDNISTRT